MAQPNFVPITEADQVRPSMPQAFPTHLTGRPGETRAPGGTRGVGFGSPGPDQGFALKLAHRLREQLVLTEGEDHHDVEVGASLIATKRASLFGRAPTIYDLRAALGLFGYLGTAPAELVAIRISLFQGVAHRWEAQRLLVDCVPEEALALSHREVSGSDWLSTLRELLRRRQGHPSEEGLRSDATPATD